jgi:hypothetical protein
MADAVTVDALRVGDHACLTFTDPDERLDLVAAFVAEGLDHGDKVVCFTDSVPRERLPGELAVREVATADALRRGQLVILGSDQSWLKAGSVAAAAMVDMLATEVQQATGQGYPGLRVTADMCWATRPVAAVDQLVAFEQTVAELFADGRLTAICQYEPDSFDPVTLAFAAQVHPKTVAAAVYHDTPLLRICRQHRPPGIRLAGEIDYNQLEPLQQALAEALRLDTDIHVNLTKLRFIDVTTATAIAKAALSLPADRRMIVTCDPSIGSVFALLGAGEVAQLRVQQGP